MKIPLFLTFIFAASVLWALEPSDVLIVVNPRSSDSLKVANFYSDVRNIPPENVFYLDFDDAKMEISWDDFYNNLFLPISRQARLRGCCAVALSPGFPLSVNLKDVFDESTVNKQFNKVLTKIGAVNGLIYLGRLFEQESNSGKKNLNLLMRNYYIYPERGHAVNINESILVNRPIKSFDSTTAEKHLLCCFLLTPTRGYSVSQGIENLKQSVAADGTFPSGTIYLMANADIRTKARESEFFFVKENIDYLKRNPHIRVQAEIVQTQDNLPQGKKDIIGLSAGTKVFNWEKSRCKILPGAICENFTSYGGVLYKPSTQTPLTVFLFAGAAGSSGTAEEPYALPEKFPSCAIHYKYLSGLSLIEAYYSSVQWPYQLVIVGDLLCKPWAEKSPTDANSIQYSLPPGIELQVKQRPIYGEEISLKLTGIPEKTSSVEICSGNRILAIKEKTIHNTIETTISTVKLGEGSVTLIIRFKNRSGQTDGVYYTRLNIQPVTQTE